MNIRGKALAGTIVILLLFLAALVAMSSVALLTQYQHLEERQVTASLDTTVSRIQSEVSVLSALAKAWGESDAMYAYAEGKNPGFIRQTLPSNTFRRYDINAIIIVGKNGEILYAQGFDYLTGKTEEVPAGVLLALSRPGSPLMAGAASGYAGVIDVPEKGGPAFFVSYPILHSNQSGPPGGAVIIGKYIYDDELEKYRADGMALLALTSAPPDTAPSGSTAAGGNALTRSAVTLTAINDSTIRGETFLVDGSGTVTARIAAEIPRTVTGPGRGTLFGFILIELATGLVLGLFILILLDRIVLVRVQRLIYETTNIASTGTFSGRVDVTRDDEISQLSRSINRVLDRVEESRADLIRSEQKLVRAEKLARFGHWEYDTGTGTLTISPGARLICGIGDGEYTLAQFNAIALPRYQREVDAALDGLITGNRAFDVECPIRRPEDNAVVILRSIAEYDPVRHVVFGVIHDITGIKAAERALKESEERYRSLTDNLPELVVVHRDGRFLYANEALARGVGISREDLAGRSIFEFVAPEDRALVIRNGRLRALGAPVESFEVRFLAKGGERKHGLVNSTLIRYQGEEASLVIITDITGRKIMEEALSAANRKLQMLSSITRHDIRNKILGLRSYIAIGASSARDEPSRVLFMELEETARTIDEQLEFTRTYQTLGMHAPQWIDVHTAIGHVTGQLNFGKAEVFDETEGLEILADCLLEKVFYNLFDNAIRYADGMTEIRIHYRQEGQELVLFVEDNGAGIPAEDKEDIFDRGFGKNTGLGLFIIREILSITGISIRETGISGNGACFEIHIPPGVFRFTGPGRQDA